MEVVLLVVDDGTKDLEKELSEIYTGGDLCIPFNIDHVDELTLEYVASLREKVDRAIIKTTEKDIEVDLINSVFKLSGIPVENKSTIINKDVDKEIVAIIGMISDFENTFLQRLIDKLATDNYIIIPMFYCNDINKYSGKLQQLLLVRDCSEIYFIKPVVQKNAWNEGVKTILSEVPSSKIYEIDTVEEVITRTPVTNLLDKLTITQ